VVLRAWRGGTGWEAEMVLDHHGAVAMIPSRNSGTVAARPASPESSGASSLEHGPRQAPAAAPANLTEEQRRALAGLLGA
jgi:hypothetical protein